MDFLPEYSSMEINGRHRPLFRLFSGAGWKYVRKDGRPIECDSALAAVNAAKECVKAILNPPIRSEKLTSEVLVVPDILDVDAWRQSKAENEAAERERVFSGTIFREGRAIKVEKRRARA